MQPVRLSKWRELVVLVNVAPARGWTGADADGKLQGPGWKYSQDLNPVLWAGHCAGGTGEGGSWQHRGSTNSIITTEASANPRQGLPSKPRELLPDLPFCSHTYQQENKDAY